MSHTPIETTPKPSRGIEFVEPEKGMLRTYSNHIRAAWTAYDMRLSFGEVVDATSEKITIEETVQVTMTWAQAMQLLDTLQRVIADHEAAD